MAVCPSCRVEYTEGVERCADCDVELVSEAEPRSTGRLKLRRLTTFATVAEAKMIQELLERNGIESIISGEADPIGVTSGAVVVRLLVDEKDFARALELLPAEAQPPDES
jgi:hypothetical protein